MNTYINKQKTERFGTIFSRLHYKINFDINNTSSFLLATDLLRDNCRRQLFKIVAVNVERLFCHLLEEEEITITKKRNQDIFFSLIQEVTQDFLMSFYDTKIQVNAQIVKDSFYTTYVVNEEQILLSVPLQILSQDNAPLFQSIFVPVYKKAYDNFIEALLDNLIIEVANAVMFIILNEFSFIYEVRKSFYRSNFLSLRNIERFRNNLNWQCRIRNYIKKPSDMYNSQQGIWIIRTTGIYYRVIYANRANELMQLKNLSLLTLLTIETKDFLVARVEESFYFFGSSIRYTLTSVIGQIIGLVWRGIIEGLKK